MKEHKQVSQVPVEQMATRPGATDKNGAAHVDEHKPVGTTFTGQKPLRPGFTMQSEVQTRRGRGRLSREALIKLGKVLETYFDNVRQEGVPDRFKQLLDQYDERRAGGQASQPDEPNKQALPDLKERKDKGSI